MTNKNTKWLWCKRLNLDTYWTEANKSSKNGNNNNNKNNEKNNYNQNRSTWAYPSFSLENTRLSKYLRDFIAKRHYRFWVHKIFAHTFIFIHFFERKFSIFEIALIFQKKKLRFPSIWFFICYCSPIHIRRMQSKWIYIFRIVRGMRRNNKVKVKMNARFFIARYTMQIHLISKIPHRIDKVDSLQVILHRQHFTKFPSLFLLLSI